MFNDDSLQLVPSNISLPQNVHRAKTQMTSSPFRLPCTRGSRSSENGLAASVKLSGVSRYFVVSCAIVHRPTSRQCHTSVLSCWSVWVRSGTGTVVQSLVDAIDLLVKADVAAWPTPSRSNVLERELSRFEAIVTKAVAAFDASGDWANDGAKGAAPWVAIACRLPRAAARRQVPRGRMLRHLPEVTEAWERGHLSSAHLDLVASVRREGTKEALSRDEASPGQSGEIVAIRAVRPSGGVLGPAGRSRRNRGGGRGSAGAP